jgi:glucose/arabinose dehydrogenase
MTSWKRFIVGAIAIVACSENPSEPTSGSLTISITGLPQALQPSIVVNGPGSFSRTVTANSTLADLAPGAYTVAASSAATYVATPLMQSVAVAAGATSTATVTYAPSDAITLTLETVASGLDNPVYVTSPPGDPRLFVVEQTGRIRIISNGTVLSLPFLDLRSRITRGGEQGLLSVAFHPSYATNGFFFVNFTDTRGDTQVERFHVSANPDVADPASNTTIITVAQPFTNHNGGLVMFGPDGMLYIGMGDGGSGGDPQGNGQSSNTLLGKMLRIDVNGALPYVVPPTNPFVNRAGTRPEIWASGLRNPWRFSFDRQAGLLYIADVGQGDREEIDVVPSATGGVNYGWNTMEGVVCYASTNCNRTGLTLPVLDYRHTDGCSVTGGYVYRGARIPAIAGRYFYSDYCSGWLRSFRVVDGAVTSPIEWPVGNIGNVTSFGEDSSGELYITVAAERFTVSPVASDDRGKSVAPRATVPLTFVGYASNTSFSCQTRSRRPRPRCEGRRRGTARRRHGGHLYRAPPNARDDRDRRRSGRRRRRWPVDSEWRSHDAVPARARAAP